MNFKDKNILVVGMGRSGQAAVRFLRGEGAHVAATDSGRPTLSSSCVPQELHFGGSPAALFKGRDLIVVSPGVPLTIPGLVLARKRRIPILGEFGLAAAWIARRMKTPVIAVTGTNGKSTTVTLITRMLEKSGKKAALAGNIGKPLMEVVLENRGRKKTEWPDCVVAEVSSYQLETAPEFHPKISVLLNITEDHLDRYASFAAYARAKRLIFRNQGRRDLFIYKEDDPMIRRGLRGVQSAKAGFSLGGNFRNESIVVGKESYPLSRTRLVGLHNVENMTASILAARRAGVSPRSIQSVLESFEGLAHRTAFVRELEGVRYYDDSKGTNVDAVVKSLAGFPDGRVILIAGGRDKGGSYEPLRKMAVRKVKRLMAFGEARGRIRDGMGGGVPVSVVATLEAAVLAARREASPGDVVLLSPACSSFDQFKDYKERGDRFQSLVRELS